MPEFDIAKILMALSALILGITVHEWAHAVTADALGDKTPRSQGRVTLYPPAHLDPVGTLFMVFTVIFGFGFGWGRPVLTDPRQYKINWRIADSLVALAGPVSNLVIAIVFALILRSGIIPQGDVFEVWAVTIVMLNVVLLLFNLLPIYPLDGSHLLANALPERMGQVYRDVMMKYGLFIFLGILILGIPSRVLGPAVLTMVQFLIG
ncbi:MAG: site-2 protease family protein [Armatimonadaceae bacterium]